MYVLPPAARRRAARPGGSCTSPGPSGEPAGPEVIIAIIATRATIAILAIKATIAIMATLAIIAIITIIAIIAIIAKLYSLLVLQRLDAHAELALVDRLVDKVDRVGPKDAGKVAGRRARKDRPLRLLVLAVIGGGLRRAVEPPLPE